MNKEQTITIIIECEHDFRYSHIEYPPTGTYSVMPPNKEVVVCKKCGKIIKTILV